MDIIETNTATTVEMLARDKTTVGSLEPAPESAMFLSSRRVPLARVEERKTTKT
jgi:hypothetical protein